IAAALSEAERLDVDGGAFLEALAVGYEVCCRVGAAMGPGGYERGFHITGVSGIFGAVAAAAKLRGLDRATVGAAFGLALSKAGGSMQYLENGSWNKRLHPGFAAHDALLCLTLAETGVTGAAEPIEGRYGILHSFTADPRPDYLTDGLGERWLLVQTSIKPYPSCRLTHGAIDAALRLRERVPAGKLGEATMRIGLSPTAFKITGEPLPAKLAPRNTVDAQFSVYFQVSAAWLDGGVTYASYERAFDVDILALTPRIAVESDVTVPTAGAIVEVTIDGERFADRTDTPLGNPGNPLGWSALTGKFTALAEPVYGPERAAAIVRAVEQLGPGTRMLSLIRSLRTQGEASDAERRAA
ncbi:MmgE/PrpD family protein, partial [uncultured Enterovirga sp.]|uniref:MmgE/PrpD family protein n=1 Tax=uncultured Enterovirga sp. TaxID=2026352 RepID=UPI0035CBAE92